MLWFFLSLLTAFFSATEAVVLKRFFGDLEPLEMGCAILIYSLPLFGLALVFLELPHLGSEFWITLAVLLPVNMLGFGFHMWSINVSPLSLTMPYLSFTPIFTMGVGFVLLGEKPGPWGAVGILTIVAGSWLLNMDGTWRSMSHPIRAVLKERGSKFMFVAAAAYGLGSVLGKKLVIHSDPLSAAMVFFFIFNLTTVLCVAALGRLNLRRVLSRPLWGTVAGAMLILHIACHFWAISLVNAAYMIAIKRLNGLFSVVYGGVVFKERDLGFRLAGAGLMTVGAALLAVLG